MGLIAEWKDRFKENWANRHIEKLQHRALDERELLRQKQEETGRDPNRVTRIEVYELDGRKRGKINQGCIVRTLRFEEGVPIVLSNEIVPDGTIWMDFNVLWSIEHKRYTRTRPDGEKETFEGFNSRRALNMGVLGWEGHSHMLEDLLFLDERILPQARKAVEEAGVRPPVS